MTTKEELKLLLGNNPYNKGARQLLLKNLDNMLAKYFESLYKNSGDGKVVLSVTKWLKDGVRELSWFRTVVVRALFVVRAPLIAPHPFTCENVLSSPPPILSSLSSHLSSSLARTSTVITLTHCRVFLVQ
jgi:hypothetical protein